MDLQIIFDQVFPEGVDRLPRAEVVRRIGNITQPGAKYADAALCGGVLHSWAYYCGVVRFDRADVVRRDPGTIPGRIGQRSETQVEYFDENGMTRKCPQKQWPVVAEGLRLARRAKRLAKLRADVEEALAAEV